MCDNLSSPHQAEATIFYHFLLNFYIYKYYCTNWNVNTKTLSNHITIPTEQNLGECVDFEQLLSTTSVSGWQIHLSWSWKNVTSKYC